MCILTVAILVFVVGTSAEAFSHDTKLKNNLKILTQTKGDEQYYPAKDTALDLPSMGENSTMAVFRARKDRKSRAVTAPLWGHKHRQMQSAWPQRGRSIWWWDNEAQFGSTVSMSGDGSTIVVGSQFGSYDGLSGSVNVYMWGAGTGGTDYVQKGIAISECGVDFDDRAGYNKGWPTAVSDDGNTIVIGSPTYEGDSGYARVFVWNAGRNVYVQESDIYGEGGDWAGYSVSMSRDGFTIVVASPRVSNSKKSGSVTVYVWNDTDDKHVQRGAIINGEDSSDSFGHSVSMSGDGSTFIVGAPNATSSGSAQVFFWDGENHVKRGSVIDGVIDGEGLYNGTGISVSISDDGDTVVVGSHRTNGYVRVFVWDDTANEHVQRGDVINGKGEGDGAATSVSVSGDGKALVVGSRYNEGKNGPRSGLARVFVWNGKNHAQMGSDIDDESEGEGDWFGNSVSISGNGHIIAVGAPFTGQVFVYATPSSWDIDFVNVIADFNADSTDELIVEYLVGSDHMINYSLYQKDCTTAITDIDIISLASKIPKDSNHETLILKHSLDKSMIAQSDIWNEASSEIEICQQVQLIMPAGENSPEMAITGDSTVLTIAFDLLVQFEIDGITLEEADIGSEADSAELAGYIEACKCDNTLTCNTDALSPTDELLVCIKSKSTDVKIAYLDSMDITQGQDNALAIISNNEVQFLSFSSRAYVSDASVLVTTRVPVGTFAYGGDDPINISGEVFLEFPDGSKRKLRTDIAVGGVEVSESEVASYQLQISLQDEVMVGVSSAPGAAITGKGGTLLALMSVCAFTLMW